MRDTVNMMCIKRGSSLIIRILTEGYLQKATVKFPRNLKEEGRRYKTPKENIRLVFIKGVYYYKIKNIDHIEIIEGIDMDEIDFSKLVIYEDVEIVECSICLENNKNIIFFPCGHYNTCRNCARLLKLCPVCRVKIDSKIDIDQIDQN